MIIGLTSKQQVKINAIKEAVPLGWEVTPLSFSSNISEQPWGRAEIRQGAKNRMEGVNIWPCVSLETGVIPYGNRFHDVTCCLLRTRYGTFETWSEPVLHPAGNVEKWQQLSREDRARITIGSMMYAQDSNDWYVRAGNVKSRQEVMRDAIVKAFQQWIAARMDMPSPVIPARLCDFKGVKFLDLQDALSRSSRTMSLSVRRLADRLLFDTVVVLDARGFLLAGEFMREGYPVVMARKPGKLPQEEVKIEYQKEYGTDTICITQDSIQKDAKVIVIDDLVATGGSMGAVESLVNKMGATVVAFIAPFAIEIESQEGLQLLAKLDYRLRFHSTQLEASSGQAWEEWTLPLPVRAPSDTVTITPPSLRYITSDSHKVPVRWGRYYWSSNIWFSPRHVKDKNVYVFLDPANAPEMSDVLQLLSILYRKDPRKVMVVIPFLDQSTQDRVEFDATMESVAAVDTIGTLLGKFVVHTFDLHAEQSRFAFHDLRFESLVKVLWEDYHAQHPHVIPVFPDAGAGKRFGGLLGLDDPVIFRKIRQGDSRVVHTDHKFEPDRSYVIVDDLVRSGGTMAAVQLYLEAHGAQRVDALFAHAPLEPKACQNLSRFGEIWTSDSCPRLVPSSWVKVRVLDVLMARQ